MRVPKKKLRILPVFLPQKAASLHLGLSNDEENFVHGGVE